MINYDKLINHFLNRPFFCPYIFLHRSFKIVQETMIRLKIPMVTSAHPVANPDLDSYQSYNVYPTSSNVILDEIHQQQEALFYLFSRKTESVSRFWAGRWSLGMGQNLVPLVNPKIAGKWMFIPLKMVLIGIDPYPLSKAMVPHREKNPDMPRTGREACRPPSAPRD